jgi:hypothetical protein
MCRSRKQNCRTADKETACPRIGPIAVGFRLSYGPALRSATHRTSYEPSLTLLVTHRGADAHVRSAPRAGGRRPSSNHRSSHGPADPGRPVHCRAEFLGAGRAVCTVVRIEWVGPSPSPRTNPSTSTTALGHCSQLGSRGACCCQCSSIRLSWLAKSGSLPLGTLSLSGRPAARSTTICVTDVPRP